MTTFRYPTSRHKQYLAYKREGVAIAARLCRRVAASVPATECSMPCKDGQPCGLPEGHNGAHKPKDTQ